MTIRTPEARKAKQMTESILMGTFGNANTREITDIKNIGGKNRGQNRG